MYQRLIGYTPGNKDWCRVVMDQRTTEIVSALPIRDMRALEISGERWKDAGFGSFKSAHFPEFDITTDVMDESFDIIIAEQVFEHILWPYRAGRNVFSMLNKGGYFLITTPFLLKIHEYPVDCSRWSPTGLKYFLAECGFELGNITVEGWGNESCVVANLREWMPYNPKKHSLKNDEEFPVVVWALARK
jgi:hypothetical protein